MPSTFSLIPPYPPKFQCSSTCMYLHRNPTWPRSIDADDSSMESRCVEVDLPMHHFLSMWWSAYHIASDDGDGDLVQDFLLFDSMMMIFFFSYFWVLAF